MHGPFPLSAGKEAGPAASLALGNGVIPSGLSANYDVARFILRDAANKELWRSGQQAPSPRITREVTQQEP